MFSINRLNISSLQSVPYYIQHLYPYLLKSVCVLLINLTYSCFLNLLIFLLNLHQIPFICSLIRIFYNIYGRILKSALGTCITRILILSSLTISTSSSIKGFTFTLFPLIVFQKSSFCFKEFSILCIINHSSGIVFVLPSFTPNITTLSISKHRI